MKADRREGAALLEVERLSVSFGTGMGDRPHGGMPESRGFGRGGRAASAAVDRDGRDRMVLKGLSLSVQGGEVVAVVGASGSGKTVLVDCLLGKYEPNSTVSGTIVFEGRAQDPRSLALLRGAGICLVPQSVSNLDPLMRVGRQVRGVARGRTRAERDRDRRRRAKLQRELFDRYELPRAVETLYPHELSGGMARRVLLMCALMEEPRLLVADEPTPGLDPGLAVQAVEDLRAYARTGAGVLFITHDLELASRIADRIAIFSQGRIVEEVPSRRFGDPSLLRHPFSRALFREFLSLRAAASSPMPAASPVDGPASCRPVTAGPVAAESTRGRAARTVLSARGVSFAYRSHAPLLADVSLDVRTHERIALTGPSGVGKTTLCKLLGGYLKPCAGCITVADGGRGRGVTKARPVQVVLQHPEEAFDPRMRMGPSLGEAGEIEGDRFRELRALFGVEDDWLGRYPHELSGGELMRCCLVRALGARPSVLICDEATAMLDIVAQAEVWRRLIGLQEREGFAILFVSHSTALVRRVATRVIEMPPANLAP